MSDGQIELAYCYADYLDEPDDNGLPYGTLSLIQRPVEEICDIYVDPITVADSDILPGEEINLIADVYNNGSNAVNSFEVAISDNAGNPIETITVEQLLQPGENAEINIPFTDDNGNEVNYSYTGVDLTGVTAKSNGIVTQELLYSYNNKHNLVSASQSGGASTSYTYNDRGLPLTVTVTDSEGQHATTTYTYHSDLNYLTSVTDSSGVTTQYSYSGMYHRGLITKVTDPNGNVTEYTYDDYTDNVLSISNPDESLGGVETNFTYDSFGKLETVSNQSTGYKFYYDNFGREDAVETIDGYMISCNSYYEDGSLESVYYANDTSIEYEYDEEGRVSAVTEYGEPLSEYTYTNEGRLRKLVDHENARTWLYQYDIAGRLKTATSNDGKFISYSFNDKNQPEKVKITEDSENVSETDYFYDSFGRVSDIAVKIKSIISLQNYDIDDFGRLKSASTTMVSTSPERNVDVNYTYLTHNGNQTGRVSSIEYVKNYNGNSSSLLPTLSYSYDANGNITHVYENGVQKAKYYYDSLNRLIREDNAYIDKTVVYNYNSNGDIFSKVEYALTSSESLGEPTDTIVYEYSDDSYPNVLTSYDNQSMLYDNSGNLIECGSRVYGWTEHNQLSTIAEWYRNEEGNRVRRIIDFTYDTAGIRTSKTVDGVTTEYFYVGDKLVKQSTEGKPENDLYFSYSADGSPFKVKYLHAEFFYLLNLQGDVIGLYDSAGDMIVTYVYDSWGKLISAETHDPVYEELAELNPLRYRGYYYDNETQLYYLQARYYNPEWGRFISADSLLISGDYLQGLNRYAYCFNNPICYSDPSGYAPLSASEQTAVNVATFFAYLMYIADYAERHNLNQYAVVDFLGRTTNEDSKLINYIEALEVGIIVLNGEDWFNKLFSAEGLYGDLKNVATIALGGKVKISAMSGVVNAGINILKDFWNPLMTDDDVRVNAFDHIVNSAVGVGIAVFTAELTAAVTAMTGNPYVGFAFGALVLGMVAVSGI